MLMATKPDPRLHHQSNAEDDFLAWLMDADPEWLRPRLREIEAILDGWWAELTRRSGAGG